MSEEPEDLFFNPQQATSSSKVLKYYQQLVGPKFIEEPQSFDSLSESSYSGQYIKKNARTGKLVTKGQFHSGNPTGQWRDYNSKGDVAILKVEKIAIGSLCRDGWKSNSIGQGTGSYHGGVARLIYGPKKIFLGGTGQFIQSRHTKIREKAFQTYKLPITSNQKQDEWKFYKQAIKNHQQICQLKSKLKQKQKQIEQLKKIVKENQKTTKKSSNSSFAQSQSQFQLPSVNKSTNLFGTSSTQPPQVKTSITSSTQPPQVKTSITSSTQPPQVKTSTNPFGTFSTQFQLPSANKPYFSSTLNLATCNPFKKTLQANKLGPSSPSFNFSFQMPQNKKQEKQITKMQDLDQNLSQQNKILGKEDPNHKQEQKIPTAQQKHQQKCQNYQEENSKQSEIKWKPSDYDKESVASDWQSNPEEDGKESQNQEKYEHERIQNMMQTASKKLSASQKSTFDQ